MTAKEPRTAQQITETPIIKVSFREAPLASKPTKLDFYFGSLAAIYELFTPEQIGCRVEHLWNYGVMTDRPYMNKLCVISREVLVRKTQRKGSLDNEKEVGR